MESELPPTTTSFKTSEVIIISCHCSLHYNALAHTYLIETNDCSDTNAERICTVYIKSEGSVK